MSPVIVARQTKWASNSITDEQNANFTTFYMSLSLCLGYDVCVSMNSSSYVLVYIYLNLFYFKESALVGKNAALEQMWMENKQQHHNNKQRVLYDLKVYPDLKYFFYPNWHKRLIYVVLLMQLCTHLNSVYIYGIFVLL